MSFIRRARHLGISLDDVRELITLADDRNKSCDGVDTIASGHLAAVERKIADLTLMRDELHRIIGSCRQGTVGDCKVIETLGPQISERERQRSPKELTVGHRKAKEVT